MDHSIKAMSVPDSIQWALIHKITAQDDETLEIQRVLFQRQDNEGTLRGPSLNYKEFPPSQNWTNDRSCVNFL